MTRNVPSAALASILLLASASFAIAEPTPVGRWVAEDGTRISVKPCRAGYCAEIASGAYSGQSVARVAGPGPDFKGTVRDPRSDTAYDGGLRLDGAALELRGCLAKVFCRTIQTWRRQ
ncbi:DUF2147 domain-containing protein [Aurantimonas sp. VKM B-3413]|uniref:DUF2147 domain-containing protein n=1 Tax=Aurantimonas sp. VKM B-3413 TaxID=2779401 RepID=UPI001E6044FD|nr:DUF2147 domain-containing protein [Aurantimonas sp. VKM B-3413]MCB8839507.1 DUF2147 domain-containing protein [Aurantimonas sp. VKM B-3413]